MISVTTPQTQYFQFQHFAEHSKISHFVSSRKGGLSQNRFKGLNISFETEDIAENVLQNRKILSQAVGIPLENFVMQNQVHGNTVVKVTKNHRGKGIYNHQDVIGNSDAMISNESSVCLFLFAADCVPILFYDPVQHAIGAAHSGWGGTVKKIACETIFAMQHHFNSRPQDILVGIGPSISVKNYEVGDNVTQAVLKAFGTTDNLMIRNAQTGKMHFDLWQTNKQMLMEIGVKNENIEISGLCTFGNPELFFSARRDEPTGRFGAGIMING